MAGPGQNPDSVNDRLWDLPTSGRQVWQDDATVQDTNEPGPSTFIAPGQPTSIDGNLRKIKSEVKRFALDPEWVNYLGCNTAPGTPGYLGAPNPDPPKRTLVNQFTLVGNWRDTPYAIASVGRMVRVTFGDPAGTRRVAPITHVSVTAGVTSINLLGLPLDVALWTDGVSYVEFSAVDPLVNPQSGGMQLQPHFPPGPDPSADGFFLPIAQGGTGNTTGRTIPTGVVGGVDVTGLYPDALRVQGLQLREVGTDAPIAPDATNKITTVLTWWDKTGFPSQQAYRPFNIVDILKFLNLLPTGSVNFDAGTLAGSGFIHLPFFSDPDYLMLQIQWSVSAPMAVTGVVNSIHVSYPEAFVTSPLFLVSGAYTDNGAGAVWTTIVRTVNPPTNGGADVQFLSSGGATTANIVLLAVGY